MGALKRVPTPAQTQANDYDEDDSKPPPKKPHPKEDIEKAWERELQLHSEKLKNLTDEVLNQAVRRGEKIQATKQEEMSKSEEKISKAATDVTDAMEKAVKAVKDKLKQEPAELKVVHVNSSEAKA